MAAADNGCGNWVWSLWHTAGTLDARFGTVKATTWQKEAALFVLLLAVGAAVLPFAIYFVGQNVIGGYVPGAGASDLLLAIWADLSGLRPAAWILVLSPYCVVTLVRISVRKWRVARSEVA